MNNLELCLEIFVIHSFFTPHKIKPNIDNKGDGCDIHYPDYGKTFNYIQYEKLHMKLETVCIAGKGTLIKE